MIKPPFLRNSIMMFLGGFSIWAWVILFGYNAPFIIGAPILIFNTVLDVLCFMLCINPEA